MDLKTLFADIPGVSVPEKFQTLKVSSITTDSRKVSKGSLFIALQGTSLNGAAFIDDALKKGAGAVLTNASYSASDSACVLLVENVKEIIGQVLNVYYDSPSKKLKTIGITGTNGKTTISYLCESIVRCTGKKCGVIGTIGHRYESKSFPAKNTTPGIVENYEYLSEMASQHIDYCLMEVSSHALDQGRVDGIDFAAAIFTNLTQDHLDYHESIEEYFLAKAKLFTSLNSHAYAVINEDDAYGARLKGLSKARILTYAVKGVADVSAKNIQAAISGATFTLITSKGKIDISTHLVGMHNIYNILAAACWSLEEGFSLDEIKKGIEVLKIIPGRLEPIQCGQNFNVFLDYAHTDDALKNVLTSLRDVSREKITVVFGCGGDRDKSKRPKMGEVVTQLADEVIVTSDNPRSEDPQQIIDQILQGCVKKPKVIADRKEAIHQGIHQAKPNEIILVAGKGHEEYQILNNKTISFDEHKIIKDCLHELLVK